MTAAPEAGTMMDAVKEFIKDLLAASPPRQPAAGELLVRIEERLGWRARLTFLTAVHKLREDKTLPGYQRD